MTECSVNPPSDIEKLEEEIHTGPWWTVVGFWHESWERWMGYYSCNTAIEAEEAAKADGRLEGGHLAIVGVFEGKQRAADKYATYVDADAMTQADMDAKLREWGYVKDEPKRKGRSWLR